jgi:hypothetical protein
VTARTRKPPTHFSPTCVRLRLKAFHIRFATYHALLVRRPVVIAIMRLMNTTTFKLAEFNEDCVPVYAILSHTWNTEELTYKMVTDLSDWDTRKGAAKVLGACRKVAGHNIPYIWIDTCCIDKSSSAELTEAINSMFKWYKGAKECLVYLSDFDGKTSQHFDDSKWFTRGWTLQELLAPDRIYFYDRYW